MKVDHGFTLLELLIIIAILAILVGIVAMNLDGLPMVARRGAALSESEMVRQAAEVYATQDMDVDGQPWGLDNPFTLTPDDLAFGAGESNFKKYLARPVRFAWTVGLDTATGVITVTAVE
ncbi:MAG: prepilin-type N-terminal cleavage/methylation domain-containing protein [Anaerolineae bacterium]